MTGEAREMLADIGVEETGLDVLAQVGFRDPRPAASYLPAGPKETRAWQIHKGDTAPRRRRHHTDFQRGFIKAEIISFDDLLEFGSIADARAAGKVRPKARTLRDGGRRRGRLQVQRLTAKAPGSRTPRLCSADIQSIEGGKSMPAAYQAGDLQQIFQRINDRIRAIEEHLVVLSRRPALPIAAQRSFAEGSDRTGPRRKTPEAKLTASDKRRLRDREGGRQAV